MRRQGRGRRHLKYVKAVRSFFEELLMNCQGSLVYAHLALPALDPDEVRDGQIVVLLLGLSVLLATRLLLWATMLL
jgi:hypothetical protein